LTEGLTLEPRRTPAKARLLVEERETKTAKSRTV